MSAGLATSIVTPGRTAPLVSLTTPAIALCAYADAGAKTSHASAMRINFLSGFSFMSPPTKTPRVTLICRALAGAGKELVGTVLRLTLLSGGSGPCQVLKSDDRDLVYPPQQ